MNKKIKFVGEIDFMDIKTRVFFDPYAKPDYVNCVWQSRNPSSYYQGYVFMDFKTGKMSYPEGAVISEQTEKDREMLPKFLIVGKEELTESLIKRITEEMESGYKRRNKQL